MKVYVVLVDYRSGHDTKVYGVYKQYRQAYLEERRLLEVSDNLWGKDQIKVRIVDQEVSE